MKKSNSSFYGFIAVLIIAASFYYSWKYILPKMAAAKSDLTSLDARAESAQAKLDSIVTVKNDLAEIGTLTNRLFLAVPADSDAPNLLTELEVVFKQLKFTVPNIQILDASASTTAPEAGAATASNPNAVSVSFSVNGSFQQLNALIGVLEKDIRFANIQNVNLSSGDDGALSLALQMEVYKRPSATVPTAATGAGAGSTGLSGEDQ